MDISGSGLFAQCETCRNHVLWDMSHRASEESLWRLQRWIEHTKTASCQVFGKSRTHKGNGRYSGPFAFTFTKSPEDPLSVGDMLAAVRKVMSQKSCPVIRYAWYFEHKGFDEHGAPLHPHIHGLYETETGGRIEKKHWRRAWSIWDEDDWKGSGFRGGYHRPVRSDEGYAQYIKKQGGMSESFGVE